MQLVKMGKIVLTVKWNKCKIPLPEAVSKSIFQKNCSSNSTKNL